MSHQELLGKEKIGKLLLKYSVPAIIGMLVNALYNVVDRIFIGNIPGVGSLAITGVGVTLPITTIVLGFSMLVGVGATTTISIRLGQGKKRRSRKSNRKCNYIICYNCSNFNYNWISIWRVNIK